jgi:hypothetical protein
MGGLGGKLGLCVPCGRQWGSQLREPWLKFMIADTERQYQRERLDVQKTVSWDQLWELEND